MIFHMLFVCTSQSRVKWKLIFRMTDSITSWWFFVFVFNMCSIWLSSSSTLCKHCQLSLWICACFLNASKSLFFSSLSPLCVFVLMIYCSKLFFWATEFVCSFSSLFLRGYLFFFFSRPSYCIILLLMQSMAMSHCLFFDILIFWFLRANMTFNEISL